VKSKPDRGWAVVDSHGRTRGTTFNRLRVVAQIKWILKWSDPPNYDDNKPWRWHRDHGCRCVRVEVREIGGEESRR